MATPILLRLLLITTIVLPCLLPAVILPAGAQSPLEEQRKQSTSRKSVGAALAGRVVAVQGGVIYTSIIADRPSAGITDGTVLRVHLAGRILNARFLSPSHYSQVLTDSAARTDLDVDVACTVDRDGSLAVVGLSGNLTEWLGVKSGSPVSVVKP